MVKSSAQLRSSSDHQTLVSEPEPISPWHVRFVVLEATLWLSGVEGGCFLSLCIHYHLDAHQEQEPLLRHTGRERLPGWFP